MILISPVRYAGLLAAILLVPVIATRATLVVQITQSYTASSFGVDTQAVLPDAAIAVGPSHVVEFINGRYSVYDKANEHRLQTMTDLSFWSQAGVKVTSPYDVTDPRLFFDVTLQRWFASEMDDDPTGVFKTNRFLLAVSASADPTGTWRGVAFASSADPAYFLDFPTLGLDANAVYLAAVVGDDLRNPVGATLVSIPKADLLTNPPSIANRTAFGLLSHDTYGYIMQPTVTADTASGREIVLATGGLGFDWQTGTIVTNNTLVGFTIENASGPGSAQLSNPTVISIPPFTAPLNPPQPGGSSNIDNGDARLSSTVFRLGNVLYAIHATQASNRASLQWFKIDVSSLAVIQTGVISDPGLDLFYPAIAANAAGTVVIVCNGCSLTNYISGFALVGETVNGVLTFDGPRLLHAGTASYANNDSTGTSRWGDYNAITVDPADATRFWILTLFASGRKTWSTQITELATSPLTLAITSSGTNNLISWPTAATGFHLQFSTNLPPNASWLPVSQSPSISNSLSVVSLPASGPAGFLRLIKQ